MASLPSNDKLLLAFLALYETSAKDGYLGAILITDSQGIPQEFRCSHPVKPTNIQKPLYGETLEPYIGIHLCGIPLIESTKIKPSLVMVNKEYLVGIRSSCSYPVIFLRKAGEAIDIKISNNSNSQSKRERIDCGSGKFQPIVFETHSDFDEDLEPAKEILNKIFNYLDPTEPFNRIEKAIEVLGKHDSRFQ